MNDFPPPSRSLEQATEMQFVCECVNTVRNWAFKQNKQTKQTDFKGVTKLLVNSRLGSQIVVEDAKEKGTRKVGPPLPSFLPFYFRVCAFSIQRTRLSRSLEQANQDLAKNFQLAGGKPIGHMQAWPRRWTLDYREQLQKAVGVGPWINIPVI